MRYRSEKSKLLGRLCRLMITATDSMGRLTDALNNEDSLVELDYVAGQAGLAAESLTMIRQLVRQWKEAYP